MSTRIRTAIPLFGRPPAEYDPRWASDLQRTFGQFVDAVLNPGEARATTIVLTDLPTDDVGLEAGTLYKQGNVVYVSTLDIVAAAGSEATMSDGDVTVLTT